MEKQSGSESMQSVSSPHGASTMQKQLSSTTTDDLNPRPSKMRRIDENRESTLSQKIDQLELEDPFDFGQFTPTTDQACSQVQISTTNSQKSELLELSKQLAQAGRRRLKLLHELDKIDQHNTELNKCADNEDKIQEELIEKQNISNNLLTVIQEQTSASWNMLEDLRESRDGLKKIYNMNLERDEKIRTMKQNFKDYVSNEERELADKLMLMDKQLFCFQNKYQELEHQVAHITEITRQKNGQLEHLKKVLREKQQKSDEDLNAKMNIANDIQEKLGVAREEKSKLLAVKNANINKYEELVAKHGLLQGTVTERQREMQDLESIVQELNNKQENLMREVDELKSTNLAIISKTEMEITEYSKQIKDLELDRAKTTNELTEVNLKKQTLSDTLTKEIQRNAELSEAVQIQAQKRQKVDEDLINASEIKRKLSVQTQNLDQELIARKKLLSEIQVKLDNSNVANADYLEREFELKTKLQTSKQQLEKKIQEVAKHHKRINYEDSKYSEEILKFKQDLEQKNIQINELRKVREDLKRKEDHVESENSKKLQQLNHLATQCEKLGHEKRLKELTMRIDILRQEISAEKLKWKQEKIKNSDTEKKENAKRSSNLKEIKAKIVDIKKLISASETQQNDLKETLKNVQTHNDAKDTMIQEPKQLSPLLSTIYAKHKSVRISSTPEHSPTRENHRIETDYNFDFSDMSSINGSDIFDDREREYADYLQSNRTTQN